MNIKLHDFIQFAIDLYKGCEYYAPPIIEDEVAALDKNQNPAFEFCEAEFWMIYDKGKPVGRVMGIINHKSTPGIVRFAYCDFIDDKSVSKQLLDYVRDWGLQHGCTKMEGPLGLSDVDQEGCLIEGFDQLATSVELYNYPYYKDHFEAYGMKPGATWLAYRIKVPEAVPEKHIRIAKLTAEKYGLKVITPSSQKELVEKYGYGIFELINKGYAPLHGFVPFTDKQVDYYIKLFLPKLRMDLIRLIEDKDGNMVAFGICLPSISKALQKANGRMLPTGWFHLAKAMYTNRGTSWWNRHLGTDTVDLLLTSVTPELQGFGINASLFTELIPQFIKNGYTWVETNNELVYNHKIRNLWSSFPNQKQHKKRCTFEKSII